MKVMRNEIAIDRQGRFADQRAQLPIYSEQDAFSGERGIIVVLKLDFSGVKQTETNLLVPLGKPEKRLRHGESYSVKNG